MVIGGLAVGVAIGTALRKLFGTARVVRAEEAAVEGALVLRRARAALEADLGRAVTPTEARQMFEAYEAQLERLGFEQQANGQWVRTPSSIERLLG